MSIESELRTYLLSQTDFTDLAGQRVHFDEIPEGVDLEQTLLLVSLASGQHGDYMDGTPQDLQFPDYSFECRAATKSAAIELADVVRRALQKVSLGIDGTNIAAVTVQSESDGEVTVVTDDGQSIVLKTRILTAKLATRIDVSVTT